MPLPVAHCLIGASIIAVSGPDISPRRDWGKLLLGAALAASPDLDYFLIWIFDFSSDWHRGFSHSITFGICLGLLIYVFRGRAFIKDAVVYGIAITSHGLVDALVSINAGVQLLWPLPYRFAFGLMEYPDNLDWRYHASSDVLVISGIDALLISSWYELLICGSIFCAALLVNRLLRDRHTIIQK